MSEFVAIERDGTVVIKGKRGRNGWTPFTQAEEKRIRNHLIRIIEQRPMSRVATSSCHKIIDKILKLNREVIVLRKQFMKIKKEHDSKDDQLELLQTKLASTTTCGAKDTPEPRQTQRRW